MSDDAYFEAAQRRVHVGPAPGTRVIVIELPPDHHYGSPRECNAKEVCDDDRRFNALYTGCANIARALFPDAFIHSTAFTKGLGKHGAVINDSGR